MNIKEKVSLIDSSQFAAGVGVGGWEATLSRREGFARASPCALGDRGTMAASGISGK